MSKTLKIYAENKGWTYDKSIASGEENGYLFTIIQKRRIKTFIVPLTHITEEHQELVKSFLNKQKTDLNLSEFDFDNGNLLINVKEAFSLMTDNEIDSFLLILTKFFKTNHIGTQKYCVFCGLEAPDQQCTLNNILYHTHSDCYKHHLKSKTKKKDYSGRNYLLGTLGALLGGIIGAIPWLIIGYFGFFTSFLGYLIGIASLKGYKMLGGKHGFKTRWIILICTLFSVVFTQMMTFVIFLIIEGYDLSLYNLIEIILYNLTNFIINTSIGILFALLGIYRLFKDLGE